MAAKTHIDRWFAKVREELPPEFASDDFQKELVDLLANWETKFRRVLQSDEMKGENKHEVICSHMLRTIANIEHLEKAQRATYEKMGERILEVERREKAVSKTESEYKAAFSKLKKEKEEFDLNAQLTNALQEMNAFKEEIIQKQANESAMLR